jgi:glycosyltransferase involved in cell wall biosynthesis
LAAKRCGLLALSYIPFAHTQAEMGAKLGRFRDPFNAYLLDVPDLIITISRDAKEHFRARGTQVPIAVVYNGIDVDRFGGDQAAARRNFKLPETGLVIALCGRLESVQKGQPLLLEAISKSEWLKEHVTTLFVGDGPDENKLRSRVRELGLSEKVRFTGWCDPAPLYPALDAVVLASRYEGMPLVMLEALASGVPVIAPDRDGMREVLPDAWRFVPGNPSDLARVLQGLLSSGKPAEVVELERKVRDEMSISAFQRNFTQTIRQHCGLS